ncbi:larval cuticle protein A2B-like [Cimex lectularius]|uniref:CPR type cuticle protein n=1 Tax=Cimex lectularius TaxID=79782 RepID=A0A8I6SRI4_CIMLE|nr:larval cuticle protein A2B-like [Cimex lectularius]
MYKLCLLAVVIAAVGAQHYGHEEGHHHHVDYYTEPHYYFEYDVKDPHTGDFKSHKEQRKGDHTEGVYSLVEPDGSKRVVEYVVEGKKGGFVPKVHRGPGKLVDHKHGHVGYVHANYNFHQGHVQEVQYHSGGHGGHQGGFGGQQGGFGGGHGGY